MIVIQGGVFVGSLILLVAGLVYVWEGFLRKEPGLITKWIQRSLFFGLLAEDKTKVFLGIAGILLMISAVLFLFGIIPRTSG